MKKIKKTLKEKKSILWIIVFTLLLLFIGAPLFNATATNKWSFHFINENNYDAWIGYYGSILGGALTLGGVWWTIKDQEMQRIKNLSIQYRPLLKESYYEKKELNIGENYRGLLWIVDCENTSSDMSDLTIFGIIELKNIGSGTAKNITMHIKGYKNMTNSNLILLNHATIEKELPKESDMNIILAYNKTRLKNIKFENEKFLIGFEISYQNEINNEKYVLSRTYEFIFQSWSDSNDETENKINVSLLHIFYYLENNLASIIEE